MILREEEEKKEKKIKMGKENEQSSPFIYFLEDYHHLTFRDILRIRRFFLRLS